MTKADIARSIYTRVGGFSKAEAVSMVDVAFETIKETLGRGAMIKVSAFGNFVLRNKHERQGRNPQTGEPMPIAGRRVLTFKASKILKQALNRRAMSAGGEGETAG